jgi:hypothetical protein
VPVLWYPLVSLTGESRCMVVTGAAYAYGTQETVMYHRAYDGQFRAVLGEKNSYCFYPAGVGDCI